LFESEKSPSDWLREGDIIQKLTVVRQKASEVQERVEATGRGSTGKVNRKGKTEILRLTWRLS